MTDIYVDFDGVILDTWHVFYNKYFLKYKTTLLVEEKIKNLMVTSNWEEVLRESPIINNSINNLSELSKKYNIIILTKVNCLNERENKLKYLRNIGLENIIFIDYNCKKSSIINPFKKILIDDDIQNLDDWAKKGGICFFFNSKSKNIDSYGKVNNKYELINNLLQLYDKI